MKMFNAEIVMDGLRYIATVYAITYSPISGGMIAVCRTDWSDDWYQVPLSNVDPIKE